MLSQIEAEDRIAVESFSGREFQLETFDQKPTTVKTKSLLDQLYPICITLLDLGKPAV